MVKTLKRTRKARTARKARKAKKGGGLKISYPSFNVNNSITDIDSTFKAPTLSLLPLVLSTFIMYDPDASVPSWIHWLVINIPNGDISQGYIVLSYTGPSPPPNTGTHRYIFNQLEQKEPISIDRTMKRYGFHIDDFIKQYNLIIRATNKFSVATAAE